MTRVKVKISCNFFPYPLEKLAGLFQDRNLENIVVILQLFFDLVWFGFIGPFLNLTFKYTEVI